ncbi:MAG: alanine dehydrogenase [Nitrospinaceae bacterium]|nr:alanine dehydrogenase [Nitrospinaceae bacterium]NIR54117.1 alanine dehydrogenase [Nitrospinaceae bacterium]NIS84537.1 alanine dehydrogenase [Nitrospinaceae bacterium]NIT81329.1 alanine dehydrogenase [Nitrospinaceae bacterium]NIU43618.1 alanine dehydrogenase [Nitrospinaceae bacterium]
MIVGVPKEVKDDEYRVSMTPGGVAELIADGHNVLIEHDAGEGSGIHDIHYESVGASMVSCDEVYDRAEMIVKVKEPVPSEYCKLKENQILYTYLHLAPAPELAEALLQRKIIGIAYETVQLKDGSLPLLIPMSEVAGRMSIHEGAKYLERENGGRGILLGGVPGVDPGHVVIIGGGIVGLNAAKMAIGTGARVTLLDVNLARLRYIDDIFGGRVKTIMSNKLNIREFSEIADLLVGAVLLPGARSPKLITHDMIRNMMQGSVVVDVGVDQGGILETSRPTTHSNPIFLVDGVVHYCVANMPGALARTSTYALTNATLHYARELAGKGPQKALLQNPALARGLNLFKGKVTHPAVADALEKEYVPPEKVLS